LPEPLTPIRITIIAAPATHKQSKTR